MRCAPTVGASRLHWMLTTPTCELRPTTTPPAIQSSSSPVLICHGRGLLIVNALSRQWGVDREDRAKTVWADIALSGDFAPKFECQD